MSIDTVRAARLSEWCRHLAPGSIPYDSFQLEELTHYCPWEGSYKTPDQWMRENVMNFIFHRDYIIRSMAGFDYQELPAATGIYFLGDGRSILYVGQSKNIKARVARHTADKDFTHVWCFGGVPEMFLDNVESHYIRLLVPPFNAGPPSGSTLGGYLTKL